MIIPPLNNYSLSVRHLECFRMFACIDNVVNISVCTCLLICLELIAYFMISLDFVTLLLKKFVSSYNASAILCHLNHIEYYNFLKVFASLDGVKYYLDIIFSKDRYFSICLFSLCNSICLNSTQILSVSTQWILMIVSYTCNQFFFFHMDLTLCFI